MADEVIFGVDVSRIDADRLMAKFIQPEWIDIERSLQTGKWFDYRFLSPVAATYLFAHEFTKAYRQAYQRNIDTERGVHVRPLPDDLFEIKDDRPALERAAIRRIRNIWRVRQVADAMGMPYDVYLERAFYWRTRYWNQGHLPRPEHLHSELITDRTAIDWEDFQRGRLYYSSLSQYRAANYDERVSALNDHHEHLFAQIVTRGNSSAVIARFLDEDLLPREKIISRLGRELCFEADELTKAIT